MLLLNKKEIDEIINIKICTNICLLVVFRINWREMKTHKMQVEKHWSDHTRTAYYLFVSLSVSFSLSLSHVNVNADRTQFALPKNLYKSRVHHRETRAIDEYICICIPPRSLIKLKTSACIAARI